jgi:hypothetical protein
MSAQICGLCKNPLIAEQAKFISGTDLQYAFKSGFVRSVAGKNLNQPHHSVDNNKTKQSPAKKEIVEQEQKSEKEMLKSGTHICPSCWRIVQRILNTSAR